jgi:hypothetical protein
MLAKLISLLLHAKSGAISGVFLLGATGALVSVSTANGVTTVTITEASPSPATQVVTTKPSESPKASKSPKPSSSPDSLSKPAAAVNACTDQEKVNAVQVQRVNSAFSGFHTDAMKLRKERAKTTVETADQLLKAIRQSAVKAIHATMTCKKQDDDEDEAEDSETGASSTSLNTDREKDEDDDADHVNTKKPTVVFTVTDPKAIADQAIAAMQTAFDALKNAAATTATTKSVEASHAPKVPQNSHKPEGKGKSGHGD